MNLSIENAVFADNTNKMHLNLQQQNCLIETVLKGGML